MNILKYSIPIVIGIMFITLDVRAQFEGKIVFHHYEYTDNGKEHNDTFTLFVTPKRILLQGENDYGFVGPIKTEGVLVRLDFEDFVFLTGKEEALKISRDDITAMVNFFGNGEHINRDRSSDLNVEITDSIKEIKGYSCQKFILKDKKNPAKYIEAWMTKEIRIDWGMMGDTFGNDISVIVGDELPLELIFRDGNFPLRFDLYEGNNLLGTTEAADITRSAVARAMVQIPPGVKVLSFQDYLFRKMSGQ